MVVLDERRAPQANRAARARRCATYDAWRTCAAHLPCPIAIFAHAPPSTLLRTTTCRRYATRARRRALRARARAQRSNALLRSAPAPRTLSYATAHALRALARRVRMARYARTTAHIFRHHHFIHYRISTSYLLAAAPPLSRDTAPRAAAATGLLLPYNRLASATNATIFLSY